ncbi:MAG TPA: sigma 54-interacting transcriptional regulator [Terriglobia bacterium]|nr:sigma 54-interacting transcriptional regulator [Terriglobia bacterium]
MVKIVRKGLFDPKTINVHGIVSSFFGMRHEGIVPILDIGLMPNGDCFVVRDYIPPESVSGKEGSRIESLISTILFLNSNGIVHGAIKPSNVLHFGNTIKLADPKLFNNSSRTYSEEDIRFTAPEVLKGAKCTIESDLYSIGAVIYRQLLGQDPFDDVTLNELKLKCMWVAPHQNAYNSEIFGRIARSVFGLLEKDPNQRQSAFRHLIASLGLIQAKPNRAPFVGRELLVSDLRNKVLNPSKSLRAYALYGPPGIGKSRLIEQLKISTSFDAVDFICCRCSSKTDAGLKPLFLGIRELLHRHGAESPLVARLENFETTLFRCCSDSDATHGSPAYPIERIISDLVGIVASLASAAKLVLIIEDLYLAGTTMTRFVEQLCARAAELPMTLILTTRPFSSPETAGSMVASTLGNDFQQIQIKSMSVEESSVLAQWLGCDSASREPSVQKSAGNPLFLQQQIRNSSGTESAMADQALHWMISNISDEAKPVAEVLSQLDPPVDLQTLTEICGCRSEIVGAALRRLEAIGSLVVKDNSIGIVEPARRLISSSIKRSRRIECNKRAFDFLKSTGCRTEHLARYSFDGRLFDDAAVLYRNLAETALREEIFTDAATYYEKIRVCATHGAPPLSLTEQRALARCYQLSGNARKASILLNRLLRNEAVHQDSELLSSVHVGLAFLPGKRKSLAQITLLRSAIQCLGPESPALPKRYVNLCDLLLKLGDIDGATAVFEEACKKCRKNPAAETLMSARAQIHLNKAEFRLAIHCFSRLYGPRFDGLAKIVNLALCYEHLGFLRKAQELCVQAQQLAKKNGHIYVQIMALSNEACAATKLGDISLAKELQGRALITLRQQNPADVSFNRLITVYADAAMNDMQLGDYAKAYQHLVQVRPRQSWVSILDHVYSELVTCEFYLRMGDKKQLQMTLNRLDTNRVFDNPFWQVHKTLVEVRAKYHVGESAESILNECVSVTDRFQTLYLQCEILEELAEVSLSMQRKSAAAKFARRALDLSRRRQFRVLGARALLLLGMATDLRANKQKHLYSALQEASEMGLKELVAETAYEIGALQLSQRNWVTAQEYLTRSISIIEEIAEGVPDRFRAGYMSLSPHRRALQALKICNPEVQKLLHVKSSGPDFGNETRYFAALYQLSVANGAATSLDAVVTSIVNALSGTLARSAVVVLRSNTGTFSRILRGKQDQELIERASRFIGKTKDTIYLGASETASHKPIAWVPIESATCQGGIYVACGPHEPTFTEKEIEFLVVLGTIGNSALASIENRKREPQKAVSEFQGMIGVSKAINEVFSHVQVAASNTATVLIEGESGTGKELVANAIHRESARAKGPFIAVDCGAIPESLIEAELFGAKKGSYTGADSDRHGLFEAAHGGTIFLDEISNTTPALQAKLLRVIQEREVRRIGETKARAVDVRLIVASNQNLDMLSENGTFRKDLLYRLKVLHIKVPPLRKRSDDIPMLAHAFLQKLNTANKTKKYFAPGVIDDLSLYNFPGNVRELQNAIERSFFSTRAAAISKVPLEGKISEDSAISDHQEVQSWFKDLSEGRKDFWSAVHNRYKKRDISREKVLAFVDYGLRSTRGNYKSMASILRMKGKDYRRFMDFLRRSDCLLDFRPYRKLAGPGQS